MVKKFRIVDNDLIELEDNRNDLHILLSLILNSVEDIKNIATNPNKVQNAGNILANRATDIVKYGEKVMNFATNFKTPKGR